MTALQSLRELAQQIEGSPEIVGVELRVQFGALILRMCRTRGWTQRKLAEVSGMPESGVSALVHGDENCTLDTIGRILFAFGVRGRIVELEPVPDSVADDMNFTEAKTVSDDALTGITDGKAISRWTEAEGTGEAGFAIAIVASTNPHRDRPFKQPRPMGRLHAGVIPKGRSRRNARLQHGLR